MRAGVWPVAGVDEAGRGPLAGPVAAAAVILDPEKLPRGLADSKVLTAAEREELYDIIRQATLTAMCRALHALPVRASHALVDGNDFPQRFHCPGETIIKGDATSMSIAAASIIAKVTRDRLMRRMHAAYPQYGFSAHMGYATRAHRDAISVHGQCAIHRLSFAPFKPMPLFEQAP